MEVFTRVQRGEESILVRLDRCLDDSPANWGIVVKLAATIVVISVITMLIKWI